MNSRRFAVLFTVIGVLLATNVRAQQVDKKGSQDHPLVTRLPNYFIDIYDVKEFDALDRDLTTPVAKKIHWEGKKYWIGYRLKDGSAKGSELQVLRNFEAAFAAIGGTSLGRRDAMEAFEIRKGNAVTGVVVEAYGGGGTYELNIIEMKPMTQEVTADAAAMGAALKAAGKTVIQGIFFDTGSATIKPESEPALVEMTRLLKASPALKAFIVGHTDNVGTLETNLKLSADRAGALVKALVARGIDAARLKSAGVGPYSPVASNKDDAGRAQNRRVEMVEQ